MPTNPKAYTVELTTGDVCEYKVETTLGPDESYATPTFYRKDIFQGIVPRPSEWVRMDLIPQRLVVEFFQHLVMLGEDDDV